MKTFAVCAFVSAILTLFSGASVSAQALGYGSAGGASVTLDLGIVLAMMSIIGSLIGGVVGVVKIASVFEGIRIRLSVIETKLHNIKHQLDGEPSSDE